MERPVFALRYLTGFRCLADLCEDTCCGGMNVLVSQENRDTLQRTLNGSEAERAEFSAKLIPTPESLHGYQWMLARNERGQCQFLQPDLLCSVMRRFGPAAAADTCALFPRVIQEHPEHLEVSASPACPEALRLCLFSEAGGELVSAPPDLLTRRPEIPGAKVPPQSAPEFRQQRAQLLSLLRQNQHSLPLRLLRLAHLGKTLNWERALLPEEGESLRAAPGSASPSALPLVQLLLGTAQGLTPRGHPRYNQLLERVLHTYQLAALEQAPDLASAGPDRFWTVMAEVVRQKFHALYRVLGNPLELWLERYWVNDLYGRSQLRPESLLGHVSQMLLRQSLLQFFLAGHPVVDYLSSLRAEAPRPLSAEELSYLQRATVEAIQVYAKHLDRDPSLWSLLDRQLSPESLGTDAIGRAEILARFLGPL